MAKLPNHGGEGKSSYKGTKSDMGLPQHGGEGSSVSKKTDTKLKGSDSAGPGRHLSISK